MDKYIVRQPIKDANSHVIGYEIVYSGEQETFGNGAISDASAADMIYGFLTQNTGNAFRDSLNFMTFTTTLLTKRTPRLFEKSDLVIQIEDSVIVHPLAMHFVQQYAQEGYQIAVNDFQFSPRYLGLMEFLTYIKINLNEMPVSTVKNILQIAHSMHKKCIAIGVEEEQTYQLAVELGFDGMQGTFVAAKLSNKTHASGYLRSNFFRLVIAVTRDEPDIEEIEHMISMDATLTYGLLKLVNSAYFALRRRTTSIQQAIMILGLGQLKRWIYLLSLSHNTSDPQQLADSEEFLKLSFMRATFCSELVKHSKNVPLSVSDAYLLGMFSTLEYLIDAPMSEILEEIPVTEEVREALLKREGLAGALYELVLSYEKADWETLTVKAEQLGISTANLSHLYINCMEQVNEDWKQILEPIGEDEKASEEVLEAQMLE